MIALSDHPLRTDDSVRYVFIPLRFDPEPGAWTPLVSREGFFYREIDAARVCADDLQKRWGEVHHLVRILRVFCDHPSFAEFSGDGIDAEMIRGVILPLARAADITDDHVCRLLSRATPDDSIRVGARWHEVDPETLLLQPVPMPLQPHQERPRRPGGWRKIEVLSVEATMVTLALLVEGDGAEDMLCRMMRRAMARRAAGEGPSRDEIKQAISLLQAALGEDAPANDNHEEPA